MASPELPVDDLLLLNAGQIDVAFVDGNHRFGPCYNDLRACDKLLKLGGSLLAHDYGKVAGTHVCGKNGVRRAVDLFCSRRDYRVSKVVGSIAFIARAHS